MQQKALEVPGSNTVSRILVIRRDNIGDLVCTLPLMARIRETWPQAWIGALVTRYNAEVLHASPVVDEVFSYTKAKHLAHGESAVGALLARLRLLWRLRRMQIDLVVLPASGEQASAQRMARLVGAKRIVKQLGTAELDGDGAHEVVRTGALLAQLGISASRLPRAFLTPRSEILVAARRQFGEGRILGIHISARKASQRWPAERFVELMRHMHAHDASLRFALFWAPGDESNPLHPGDDGKAQGVMTAAKGLPLIPWPTQSLAELIGGVAAINLLVCSDGGHMHLAAGLGKPIVCLFGKSDAKRWHPWGVPYRLLQPTSLDVADVSVEAVKSAVVELLADSSAVAV